MVLDDDDVVRSAAGLQLVNKDRRVSCIAHRALPTFWKQRVMLRTTHSDALTRSRRRRRCAVLAFASALFLLEQFPAAHDGLAEQIAAVSAQIAASPASPELFVKRGELYRATRQYQQALADLDRAARLDPTFAAADLVRTYVCLDIGDSRSAADAATRFLTRQPGHVGALVARARALAKLGRAEDAAADFTRALEAQPQPDLYIERARVAATAGPAAIEAALRGLDDGIRRLGPIVTLELEAIDIELRLAHYDAALARLDRVSAQAARKESWLARRGAILESAGRLDEARSTYESALAAARSLPAWTQQTAASSALIVRLRTDLARLAPGPSTHPRK
jgi:tetratricopeptide (TPR) repeat protein